MRKIAAIACLAVLAACSEGADAPAAEESAAAPEAAAEAAGPVVANGSPPGSYTVTAADGTQSTSTVNADGSYLRTDVNGKMTAEGTWAVTDGKTCFTLSSGVVECFTESVPAADGSFTATLDNGDTVRVEPKAS